MVEINKHGLERPIPADVMRQVRQRCGFGCVRCGSAFIQYDHLDPPFADALTHSADGIVLLCGGCHDMKTRGRLSEQTIRLCNKNPKAKQKSFSFGPLDVGTTHPEIHLGEIICRRIDSLISVDGNSLFSVEPPEEAGAPYRISADFRDKNGEQILKIVENEWQVAVQNWDVEVTGKRLTIRSAMRKLDLIIRTEPPEKLVIERLNMVYGPLRINIHDGHPTVLEMGGQELQVFGMYMEDGRGAIAIESQPFRLTLGIQCTYVNSGQMGINTPGEMRKRSFADSNSLLQRRPPIPDYSKIEDGQMVPEGRVKRAANGLVLVWTKDPTPLAGYEPEPH